MSSHLPLQHFSKTLFSYKAKVSQSPVVEIFIEQILFEVILHWQDLELLQKCEGGILLH